MTNIKCICAKCGKKILKSEKNFLRSKRHFCSKECRQSFNCKVKYNCDHCGKEIYLREYEAKKNGEHFCNRECFFEHRKKIECTCNICGKKFLKFRKDFLRVKNHYCSKECLSLMRKNNTQKYIGKKYNSLTALEYAGIKKNHTMVKFLCDCGRTKEIRLKDVLSGQKTCGSCRGYTQEERFMSYVTKSKTGCWLWNGDIKISGYGSFSYDNKRMLAHRYSWEMNNGKIPDGMMILHKCDVKLCVNPSHLFLGNQQLNMDDMVKKGRSKKGECNSASKLTEKQVIEIRGLFNSEEHSIASLSRKYSVCWNTIHSIVTRETWRHV